MMKLSFQPPVSSFSAARNSADREKGFLFWLSVYQGIYLAKYSMLKKNTDDTRICAMWITAAILSSFFAGLTAVLAKSGIKQTDSDVATALRTAVVVIFSWLMALVSGAMPSVSRISAKSLTFLILSGAATGASWLCYFRALSIGDVNKVAPIDKSSTVLTVILAVIVFGETDRLAEKTAGTLLLACGILMMIEKKDRTGAPEKGHGYIFWAALSAVSASLTSVLAKIGIQDVDSNAGTAVRTTVVLLMSWIVVLAKKKQNFRMPCGRELAFIVLSGIATGASWLCYYYAVKHGILSVVTPIDKMSILFTVVFSRIFFGERLSPKAAAGLGLMTAGTLIMTVAM